MKAEKKKETGHIENPSQKIQNLRSHLNTGCKTGTDGIPGDMNKVKITEVDVNKGCLQDQQKSLALEV